MYTVNDCISKARDLKSAIRSVQNDNTGPAARDLRNALATAFEEMTSVISQLNLALEQEESLTEYCEGCESSVAELLRMTDDDGSTVYRCRACWLPWVQRRESPSNEDNNCACCGTPCGLEYCADCAEEE